MTAAAPAPFRFGFGTNGFTNHRLEDVLTVLADLGYEGVALTLDHGHLDPFTENLPRQVAGLAQRLDRLGLSVVVETGSPYLLDPWSKHVPSLMSDPDAAQRRIDLLRRAVRIAAELGSPAVHMCSGPAPDGVPEPVSWDRLTAGCEAVLKTADDYGVSFGFEPEPYMFIDVVDRYLELRRRLGGHPRFGLTLDIGHAHCVEKIPLLDCVRLAAPHLVHVQIEDMRRGVHEHLEFGTGEIDFPPVLAALAAAGHRGLVSVEIQGASLEAPEVARRSLEFLRSATAVAASA
jgi:sugar phosphate isomerase/epimerase